MQPTSALGRQGRPLEIALAERPQGVARGPAAEVPAVGYPGAIAVAAPGTPRQQPAPPIIDLAPAAHHPLENLRPRQLAAAKGRVTLPQWGLAAIAPVGIAVVGGIAAGALYGLRHNTYPARPPQDCGAYDACIVRRPGTLVDVAHSVADESTGGTFNWTESTRQVTESLSAAASAACFAAIEACWAQEPSRDAAHAAAVDSFEAGVVRTTSILAYAALGGAAIAAAGAAIGFKVRAHRAAVARRAAAVPA